MGADIIVFSAGAVAAVMNKLADDFSALTGNNVKITVGTVGQLLARATAGEVADVLFITAQGLEDLVRQGKVATEQTAEVGKTGVGVAVREGVKLPDISSAAAFRQTLLDAKSLVYADPASGATAGIYFVNVLDRLGISAAVKDKSTLLPGGKLVVECVAQGRADICIHQISEIIPVKGAIFVGPLPSELQKVTTYSGGVMNAAVNAVGGVAFLRFVTSPKALPIFKAMGFGRYI